MGHFSRSSKGHHYKQGNYGSNHYQNNGLFGNLLKHLVSGSGSGSNNNHHGYQNNNMAMPNQFAPNQFSPNQSTINCCKCGSKIPTGSKFCLECGEMVQDATFCPNCGEKIPSDSKFCLKCGNKIKG